MAILDVKQFKGPDNSTYLVMDASAVGTMSVSGTTLTVNRRGGSSFSLTLPSSTDEKQKVTATTSVVYLTGTATTSTTSVGYANASVYMSSGNIVDAGGAVRVANSGNTEGGNMIYDAAEKCIKFTFS